MKNIFRISNPDFNDKLHNITFEISIEMLFGRSDSFLDIVFKNANEAKGTRIKELKKHFYKKGMEINHHYSTSLMKRKLEKAQIEHSTFTTENFEALKIASPFWELDAPIAFESKYITESHSLEYRIWEYVYEAKSQNFSSCIITLYDALGKLDWEAVKAIEQQVNDYIPTKIIDFRKFTSRKIPQTTLRSFHQDWHKTKAGKSREIMQPLMSDDRIDELNKRVSSQSQSISLMIGAGVTVSTNGPTWNSLIDKLWLAELRGRDLRPNVSDESANEEVAKILTDSTLIRARMLRGICGPGFYHKMQRVIYTGVRFNQDLPLKIAKLIYRLSESKHLGKVITFNYENLIESSLDHIGINSLPKFREGKYNPLITVVHHVHGYIPPLGEEISDNMKKSIVFGEETYNTRFTDQNNWTNSTLVDTLRNSSCIFVGFSMTDPSVRRLLEVCKSDDETNSHYTFMRLPPIDEDNLDLQITRIRLIYAQEQMMSELGVNIIWYENHSDLPLLLDKIDSDLAVACQKAI